MAASVGIIVNVVFGILSLISIMIMVPHDAGKPAEASARRTFRMPKKATN